MSAKLIMLLAFLFVGCTLLSQFMGGAYFSAGDVAVLNSLTVFNSVELMGLFSIPVINIDFFTVGVPKLIQWDYPFFGGGYELFKYFLYVISIGAVWAMFTVIIMLLRGFWSR